MTIICSPCSNTVSDVGIITFPSFQTREITNCADAFFLTSWIVFPNIPGLEIWYSVTKVLSVERFSLFAFVFGANNALMIITDRIMPIIPNG